MKTHPFARCRNTLAANASAHPFDVVKIKSVLQALGHYDAPDWGVSPYPDAALFDAIKAFQQAQGLSVDGTIKPDGETEAALARAMTPQRAQMAVRAAAQALQDMGRGGDEILAHITPEEAALLHHITDGVSINPMTGLAEFAPDSDAYNDAVDSAFNSDMSDDDFFDTYDSLSSSYDSYNSDDKDGNESDFNSDSDQNDNQGHGAVNDQSERQTQGVNGQYADDGRLTVDEANAPRHGIDPDGYRETLGEDGLITDEDEENNPPGYNPNETIEDIENQFVEAFGSLNTGSKPGEGHGSSSSIVDDLKNALQDLYTDLTAWHYEDRDRLNSPLPQNEKEAMRMGFTKYSESQSIFHQNGRGKPESKYGHPDGREAVFDGDTGELVTDDEFRGTYNYVNPSPVPNDFSSLDEWEEYLDNFTGHGLLDVAPYGVGGNVRGPN